MCHINAHLQHILVAELVLIAFKETVQNVPGGIRLVKRRIIALFLTFFDYFLQCTVFKISQR